jgi:hypothetical protein
MPQEYLLLILDGHNSHAVCLTAFEIPTKHFMLSQASRSTHRMQPLEVTFFKPFNTHEYMSSTIATKLREKPVQRLSTEHIASLVGVVFPRTATEHITSLVGVVFPRAATEHIASVVCVVFPRAAKEHIASVVCVVFPRAATEHIALLVGVVFPRAATERIASLVGMVFPRAATMETAVNWFRTSGL